MEILSMLALRSYWQPANAFKHCIHEQVTTKTSTVTPPIFIAVLEPARFNEHLHQVSFQSYSRFFLPGNHLINKYILI